VAEKSEVYLLRIQDERDGKISDYKISLREIGSEQSQTFGSLEALLYYLRYKKKQPPHEGRKTKKVNKGAK
jgi:hypothetical protein